MKMEEVKMVDHKWFEEKNGVSEWWKKKKPDTNRESKLYVFQDLFVGCVFHIVVFIHKLISYCTYHSRKGKKEKG
jgi:hypothetical protein